MNELMNEWKVQYAPSFWVHHVGRESEFSHRLAQIWGKMQFKNYNFYIYNNKLKN